MLNRSSALQVSASSSSASMDKQASEAQPPQPAESAHTESASAESAGDKATDNASEASDAPASSSFVAPLFQHFPSHSFATDAARESTSGLDSGLNRDSNASTGSFAGFESARAKAAHELFHRSSQGSEHVSVSSEASTPAMHECISGKHHSPFIGQRMDPDSLPDEQQQQQQGHGQDPGHLMLPSGPRLSVDGVPPQADGGTAGGGVDPYGPPEPGRASPRWVPVHHCFEKTLPGTLEGPILQIVHSYHQAQLHMHMHSLLTPLAWCIALVGYRRSLGCTLASAVDDHPSKCML